MIKRFQDKTKDKNFYIPTPSGHQGIIPQAGTNYGYENRVKSFKEYFGEYRKGSDKFGNLINRIMEFLRLPEFKDKISEINGLKFNIEDFEKRSNIDINKIKQLLDNDTKLYSFDIEINDNYITFKNLNKTYKDRYVSGRKD